MEYFTFTNIWLVSGILSAIFIIIESNLKNSELDLKHNDLHICVALFLILTPFVNGTFAIIQLVSILRWICNSIKETIKINKK